MKKKTLCLSVLCFLAAGAGLAAVLVAMGWSMRPDMSAEPPAYSEQQLRAAEASREMTIDPNRPIVLYRQVDYAQGPNAPWYPSGESPVLAELVKTGRLPPVAERTGPEPAVVEGVEGIGTYGGTWIRVGNSDNDCFGVVGNRMSGTTLIRWSPHGYPLVPHVAKGWEVSRDPNGRENYREFTFRLRRGMRWSNGHPFTAHDVLYWWRHEINDKRLTASIPTLMKVAGRPGKVLAFVIDPNTGQAAPAELPITGRADDEVKTIDAPAASGGKRTLAVLRVEIENDAQRQKSSAAGLAPRVPTSIAATTTDDDGGSSAPHPPTRWVYIDPYRFRVTFPQPNGLFLAKLATFSGSFMINSPAHYLRQYHPNIGDEEVVREMMAARKLASELSVYGTVKHRANPEHPRMTPWVYHTHRPNPPYSFVRNPYYFMVDTRGNQLPYIDRLHFEVKSQDMIGVTASNGQLSMQSRHLRYDQYTLLMAERPASDYQVLHWYAGDRSMFVISPNLNRKADPSRPETIRKAELLADRRFRQALSLAIDRKDIIDAEFNGQTEPAQCAPGPVSPFYEPGLYKAFTDHDPQRAGELLDALGLTRRDAEGYRTFRDGSRMQFYLNLCNFTTFGPAQFIVDDWAEIGVRAIPRIRSRQLFYTEKAALEHDLNVWSGNGEFYPLIEPRYFVPVTMESNYARAYARWYMRDGLYDPNVAGPGIVEPPVGHPMRRAIELYEQTQAVGDPARQKAIFREVLRIAAENVWSINVCTSPPALVVVKNGLRNVPATAVYAWDFLSPANTGIETFYWEKNTDSPGAIAQTREEAVTITPPPDAPAGVAKAAKDATWLGSFVRYAVLGIAVALVLMVAVRHPYIGRRLLIMVPTLLIISVVVFSIIQLPPGDYVASRIMELQERGDEADLEAIKDLERMFYLRDEQGEEVAMSLRYLRWMGVPWFGSLRPTSEFPFLRGNPELEGLLQGNLGRSMENSRPVNQIVGDRILLTMLISLGTILFTWAVAIPTGIFSAVRQYSVWDYILTFVGFIGMCVPAFLLALILMYLSKAVFGWEISGLFSSEYGAQPEWDTAKLLDLMRHIWVPVVVLGVGGTAGMIRVMRGNLLDELKKPYVTTARAKGVRPMKLLLKYPVRMALNPFVSGIGHLFPQLVSGGAIVAMVLSLPTVGPLMLGALMSEDMYLAGSMLMVLSLLGVLGTLVSDLLLLWLDPRIRYEGAVR